MDSPLVRVILATLGGYIFILLSLSVYAWVLDEYPRRPAEPMHSGRVQHQFHHQAAIQALQFYSRLPEPKKTAIKELKDKMLNVWVLGEHQNGPVETCLYFMDEIGVEKRHFATPETRSLPVHIYEWFPLLKRQTLERYRSIVVFRT